jgi:hypothetical protein
VREETTIKTVSHDQNNGPEQLGSEENLSFQKGISWAMKFYDENK